jgi:hypothetical protein
MAMAFIACCGIICSIQSNVREKSHRLLVCLSAVQTFVSTTALAFWNQTNLRTNLDPAGLLRDQSLATTTKTHRQLAAFPNPHTHHDPRNNR